MNKKKGLYFILIFVLVFFVVIYDIPKRIYNSFDHVSYYNLDELVSSGPVTYTNSLITTTPNNSLDKLYSNKGGSISVNVSGLTNVSSANDFKTKIISGNTINVLNQSEINSAIIAGTDVPDKIYENDVTGNFSSISQILNDDVLTSSFSFDNTNGVSPGTYTVIIDANEMTVNKSFEVFDTYTTFNANLTRVLSDNPGDTTNEENANNIIHTWSINLSNKENIINNDSFFTLDVRSSTSVDISNQLTITKDLLNNKIIINNKNDDDILQAGTYTVTVVYNNPSNLNGAIEVVAGTFTVTDTIYATIDYTNLTSRYNFPNEDYTLNIIEKRVYPESNTIKYLYDATFTVSDSISSSEATISEITAMYPGADPRLLTYEDEADSSSTSTYQVYKVEGENTLRGSRIANKYKKYENKSLLYNSIGSIAVDYDLIGLMIDNYPTTSGEDALNYTSTNSSVIYKIMDKNNNEVYNSSLSYSEEATLDNKTTKLSQYGFGIYNTEISYSNSNTSNNKMFVVFAKDLLNDTTVSENYNYVGTYKVKILVHLSNTVKTFEIPFTINNTSQDYYVTSQAEKKISGNGIQYNVPPSNLDLSNYIGLKIYKGDERQVNKLPNSTSIRIFDHKVLSSTGSGSNETLTFYDSIEYNIQILNYKDSNIRFVETINGVSNTLTMNIDSFYNKYYSDYFSNSAEFINQVINKYVFDSEGNTDLTQDNYSISIENISDGYSSITYNGGSVATYYTFLENYPEMMFALTNYLVIENNQVKRGYLCGEYKNIVSTGKEYKENVDFIVNYDNTISELNKAVSIVPISEVPKGTYYVYVSYDSMSGIGYVNDGSEPFTKDKYPQFWNKNIHMTSINFDAPVYDLASRFDEGS